MLPVSSAGKKRLTENQAVISINPNFSESFPENLPAFQVGQLVQHRRYGYRGVIVEADGFCKADPAWYLSNQTQPDRNQPWYHVLVHDSSSVTYAAESSLMADDSGCPIRHPYVPLYFGQFEDGRYFRNDQQWPT
ncbi:MAG: hypothetical protein Fues2KO_03010 [Fuerstiella sp.]